MRRALWLLQIVILSVAYCLVGRLGHLLAVIPSQPVPFGPEAGIALAGVLAGGVRMWPGVWLGAFLLHFGSGTSPVAAAVVGLGATAQALAGGWLIRYRVDFPHPLDQVRLVAEFLLLGGPIACLFGATVGVATLTAKSALPGSEWLFHWLTWWLGDSLGVLVLTPPLLIALGQPAAGRRWRFGAAPVFVLTLAAVLGLGVYVGWWEREQALRMFGQRTERITALFRAQVNSHEEALHSVERYVRVTPSIDHKAFALFVDRALRRNPGLDAIGWAPRLTDEERAEFEDAARRELPDYRITDRGPDGTLLPAQHRPNYVPLCFVEPRQDYAEALGFDWEGEGENWYLIRAARRLGEPVATYKVPVVPERNNPDGIVFFLATYPRNPPPADPKADLRWNLAGFVIGICRIDKLVKATLCGYDREWAAVELRILSDRGYDDSELLYDSRAGRPGGITDPDPRAAWMTWRTACLVGSRQWTLFFSATPAFLAGQRYWHAWSILVVGLLIVGLQNGLLLVMTGRAARLTDWAVEAKSAEVTAKGVDPWAVETE